MTVILSSYRARVEAAERETIREALTVSHGVMAVAARTLGLHPWHLRKIVTRLGLKALLHPGRRENLTKRGNAAWRALSDEVGA